MEKDLVWYDETFGCKMHLGEDGNVYPFEEDDLRALYGLHRDQEYFDEPVTKPESIEKQKAESTSATTEGQPDEVSDDEAKAAFAELLAKTQGIPSPYDSSQSLLNTPKKEWMLNGLLLCDGVTFLTGKSFDGKSLVTMDMTVSLISGQPWCGKTVKPTVVFYNDYDDARTTNSERLKAILHHRGLSDAAVQRLHYASADRLAGLTARNPLFPELIARDVVMSPDAQETKRALIIIDTLRTFCSGADLISDTVMTPVMLGFDRCLSYISKCGIKSSILILHHYRKNTGTETQYTAKTFDKKIVATTFYADDKTMGSGALNAITDIAVHCFLQALFGGKCKRFLEVIAPPIWR